MLEFERSYELGQKGLKGLYKDFDGPCHQDELCDYLEDKIQKIQSEYDELLGAYHDLQNELYKLRIKDRLGEIEFQRIVDPKNTDDDEVIFDNLNKITTAHALKFLKETGIQI